ncbi:MAG TPA: DNA double-strand break repair nuclease NurA [Nitrososphaera sp.]|nr:DNA double-strand break repair nuclease NurA [Nitrososphaera sp.]
MSKVKDSHYSDILSEALSRWVSYDPMPEKCESAGIDSSWNKRAFQGLNLYVIDAVAVTSTNEILATAHDYDISESARHETLESKAMLMEALLAQKVPEKKKVDIICIDGSLVSRLTRSTAEAAADMVKCCGKAIFISKSSESRLQFSSLGSKAGDIYYYGHAANTAGFSRPVQTPQLRYANVYEIYARLRDQVPIIRIEIIGNNNNYYDYANEQAIKKILGRLRYHSVAGYPYCLKLAHNNCKITNEDIDRLASIFNLQLEQGARDALNE